jgi:heme oxygenase (biliverdin-IX-beta and delta-forming)
MIAATIKRTTACIHVDAEETVRSFAPFASRDRYACYLRALRSFYGAIEPELALRLDGVVDDPSARFAKRHAIAADLAWLGADGGTSAIIRAPSLRSTASALGVAYVLEGKTLGARFLLAEARTTLDLDVDRGATFLAGYGARTGSMWNGYRASLERWVNANGKRSTVLAGARATFASFIASVSSGSPSLQHRAAS